MNRKDIIHYFCVAILFIGLLFSFMPHAFHESAGVHAQNHMTHVIGGIIIAAIGLGLMIWNNKR